MSAANIVGCLISVDSSLTRCTVRARPLDNLFLWQIVHDKYHPPRRPVNLTFRDPTPQLTLTSCNPR